MEKFTVPLKSSHSPDKTPSNISPVPAAAKIDPCPCGEKLDDFLSRGTSKGYCRVNFRHLVNCFRYGERITHSIHPYPAKLLPHIPHFLLSHPDLAPQEAIVGDPFCGSGTVMLETALTGRNAWGVDCNPLATLIAKAKTTPIDPNRILRAYRRIEKAVPKVIKPQRPSVVNLDYWFHSKTISELSAVANVVERMRAPDLKAFFQIALSVTAKRLSLADPRIPVPVRCSPRKYPKDHWLRRYYVKRLQHVKTAYALDEFSNVVRRNTLRNERLWEVRDSLGTVTIFKQDIVMHASSSEQGIPKPSTNLIITSPPYGSAQKYARSTSLSIGWLSLLDVPGVRELDKITIGREQYSKSQINELPETSIPGATSQLKKHFGTAPARCVALANFLVEMRMALQFAHDSLVGGGHFVLVMGDNTLCGEPFPMSQYLRQICENIGFFTRTILVDRIKSRGLLTRRHSTVGIIRDENVMIFRKNK